MGEVEISARAYVKMCLHAARYPHAAVNGLLLAPAPQKEECLCLTDCVPLFHSHLALSVMLEVALNQVPCWRGTPSDHEPPNTFIPSPSLASLAAGRWILVVSDDAPFPMAGGCVGCAGRAGGGWVLPCQRSSGRPEVSKGIQGQKAKGDWIGVSMKPTFPFFTTAKAFLFKSGAGTVCALH